MTEEIKKYMDERFDRLEMMASISAKPVLGVEEAARFTGHSIKGIYNLTYEKRIPHYKKNGKLYFVKQELVDWMTECRVLTDSEISSKAADYIATH